MSVVIRVKNLTKKFRDVTAVEDLSFSAESGQVYGFLGQNGAGKSTTIRMLLTLIAPTSGSIEIFGKDLFQHRTEILRNVGAIIERPDLYKYLTAFENLRLFAALSGIRPSSKEIIAQLEMVGLAERAHGKVKTYSQGMKQRLGIATALIHNPELIILDEPTNGLDPQGIADIRNLILHLSREQNKTLLVSSHLLHEIELIADSMLIIDKGRKVAEGTVEELFNPAETVIELRTLNDVVAFDQLKGSMLSQYLTGQKNDFIQLKMHKEKIPWALQQIIGMNIQVLSFYSKHSLEDYFLSLTSENQHVEAFTN